MSIAIACDDEISPQKVKFPFRDCTRRRRFAELELCVAVEPQLFAFSNLWLCNETPLLCKSIHTCLRSLHCRRDSN